MANEDIIEHVNRALLAANEAPTDWFDLSSFFRSDNPDFPVSTINDVRARLAQLGYGKTHTEQEPPYSRRFKINPTGREKAALLLRDAKDGSINRDGIIIQNHISVSPQITNNVAATPLHSAADGQSKSGTYAAWIGVIGTLVAIVVAIYLDYN